MDKSHYLESMKAALLLKTSYRRFPDDVEFRRELMAKDVYNFRSRNYLLRKLENHDRKETVDVEGYTIEHVMPQNPEVPAAWRKELGSRWREIHKQYLHTLGNLTLTGYNPELSDRPFLKKRDMKGGFADSPLRLNRDLGQLDHWDETTIQTRAERLSTLAVQVWPGLSLSQTVLEQYRKGGAPATAGVYTLDDYRYLTGETRVLFDQLRKHILNLDSSVTEEVLKLYIAYKTTTNFVDIEPQRKRLRLTLNMGFNEIYDPKGLCRDVTLISKWGNGDVELGYSSSDQLDDVMALIRQSFDKHIENGDGDDDLDAEDE